MRHLKGGNGPNVLALVSLLLVLFLGINLAQAQAPKSAPVAEQSEEVGEKEGWEEKVRKEEERRRREAVPEERPEFFPIIAPPIPYETMEVGPVTGILAPYGYPWALDTLTRGWRFHKAGAFRISPFLAYDGIYRTNIFQTSTDKLSDYVNRFRPGLKIELPLAHRHLISLGYLGGYYIYSDYSEESHYDHNVNGDIELNLRGGLGLRFGTAYRHATEERSAQFSRRRRYDRITPYFGTSYTFADVWRLEGDYQFDDLDFDKPIDRFNDFQYHTGSMTLFYKFWPKTSILLQYIIKAWVYPSNSINDSLGHTPMIGLSWDPTAKLSGTIKFGYTFRDYDTDFPGRDNSPNSWSLAMQNVYRYSNYTNIALTAQRALRDDVDFGNNAYENSAVYATLNHDWHYFKVASYLSFYYINDSYVNDAADPITGVFKQREDDIISMGAGLSRPFTPYLRLRIDYNYINKASNFSTYNFNEHRLLFGIETSL